MPQFTPSITRFEIVVKILALDTTSGACSVALYSNGQINERFVQAERDHTRRLLPMVDEVLAEAELGLSNLDAFAVSRGPAHSQACELLLAVCKAWPFPPINP